MNAAYGDEGLAQLQDAERQASSAKIVVCFLEQNDFIKTKLFSSFRGKNKLEKSNNIKPLDSKCQA